MGMILIGLNFWRYVGFAARDNLNTLLWVGLMVWRSLIYNIMETKSNFNICFIMSMKFLTNISVDKQPGTCTYIILTMYVSHGFKWVLYHFVIKCIFWNMMHKKLMSTPTCYKYFKENLEEKIPSFSPFYLPVKLKMDIFSS